MTTNQKQHNNDSNQTRIALLEQSIWHTDHTLMRIESSIDKMDKTLNSRIDSVDKSLTERIDAVNKSLGTRLDKLDDRLWKILFIFYSSFAAYIVVQILQLGLSYFHK